MRLGTTRATNALLERRGARTALVATAGFADALRIGYQDRPSLFDLRIDQPPELYETAVEVAERLRADGSVLRPARRTRRPRRRSPLCAPQGIESLAVCLLHAYRNPVHERHVGEIAAGLGFAHVSLSHRGQPAAQAHLPGRHHRSRRLPDPGAARLLPPARRADCPAAELRFMTSAGSLVALEDFSGKDAILSGPAGGVVGTARVTDRAGLAPRSRSTWAARAPMSAVGTATAFARRYEMEAGGGERRAPDAPANVHAGDRDRRRRGRVAFAGSTAENRRRAAFGRGGPGPGVLRARRSADASRT